MGICHRIPCVVYGRVGHSIAGTKEERERFSHNPLDRFYREEYGRLAKKEQLAEIQKILRLQSA